MCLAIYALHKVQCAFAACERSTADAPQWLYIAILVAAEAGRSVAAQQNRLDGNKTGAVPEPGN